MFAKIFIGIHERYTQVASTLFFKAIWLFEDCLHALEEIQMKSRLLMCIISTDGVCVLQIILLFNQKNSFLYTLYGACRFYNIPCDIGVVFVILLRLRHTHVMLIQIFTLWIDGPRLDQSSKLIPSKLSSKIM